MADGSIRFTAEIDDKDAQKALAKLERDIGKTQAAIQKTSATRNGIAESLRQAQKEAIAAYNEVERLEKALAASKALTANNGKSKTGMASSLNADEYNAELAKQQQLTAELNAQRKVVEQKEAAAAKLEAQDAKIVTQLEQQTAELERQSGQVTDINAQLAQQSTSVLPQVKQVTEAVSASFKKGFRTLLRYGLGIRSTFVLIRKLRQVLVKGIKEFANYDAETKANLDGLKESLNSLKGSFVSVGATIFNSIAPALQALIDWVAKAIEAVSVLFAILGGKTTYKRAVTGISSAAGAIGDAAGAAKELERYTSGLDELQKWEDQSSGGGGGGGGGSGGGGMSWEDVPIDMESNLAQFAINVRDILFKWDDLTPEDIAKKVITGLTTLVGLIAGLSLTGSLAGGLIFAIAGAALGIAISTIVFNGDGLISSDEVKKLLLVICGALAGATIGAVIGGPAGAALGFIIGAGITLALLGIEVDDGDGGKISLMDKLMDWLNNTAGGRLLSFALSPLGTALVSRIEWALELLPSLEDIGVTLSNWKTQFQLKWDAFWKNNKIGIAIKDFLSDPMATLDDWISTAIVIPPDFGEKVKAKFTGWLERHPIALGVVDFLSDPMATLDDWISSAIVIPDDFWTKTSLGIKRGMAKIANAVIDPLNQLISNITGALAGTSFGNWLADRLGLDSLTDIRIPTVEIPVTANMTGTKDNIPASQKQVPNATALMQTWQNSFTTSPWAYGTEYFNGWKSNFSTSPWAYGTEWFNRWSNANGLYSGYGVWAYGTAWYNNYQNYFKKKPWAYADAYFNTGYTRAAGGGWYNVTKAAGGIFKNGRWGDIASYAAGGVPRPSQLFVAREAGPELVGTLKGHTAVMNNDQIVASVSAGVAKAIAGITFHLEGLPTYQPVTPDMYPSMAQGNVIPPKITEATDKLSEIKGSIDNLAMLLNSGRGSNSYQFTAQLDRRTLFDELIQEAQIRRNQNGLNPFMAV